MAVTEKELITFCNLSNLRWEFSDYSKLIRQTGNKNVFTINDYSYKTVYELLEPVNFQRDDYKVDEKDRYIYAETKMVNGKLTVDKDSEKGHIKMRQAGGIGMEYAEKTKKPEGKRNYIGPGKFLTEWEVVYAGDNYKIITDYQKKLNKLAVAATSEELGIMKKYVEKSNPKDLKAWPKDQILFDLTDAIQKNKDSEFMKIKTRKEVDQIIKKEKDIEAKIKLYGQIITVASTGIGFLAGMKFGSIFKSINRTNKIKYIKKLRKLYPDVADDMARKYADDLIANAKKFKKFGPNDRFDYSSNGQKWKEYYDGFIKKNSIKNRGSKVWQKIHADYKYYDLKTIKNLTSASFKAIKKEWCKASIFYSFNNFCKENLPLSTITKAYNDIKDGAARNQFASLLANDLSIVPTSLAEKINKSKKGEITKDDDTVVNMMEVATSFDLKSSNLRVLALRKRKTNELVLVFNYENSLMKEKKSLTNEIHLLRILPTIIGVDKNTSFTVTGHGDGAAIATMFGSLSQGSNVIGFYEKYPAYLRDLYDFSEEDLATAIDGEYYGSTLEITTSEGIGFLEGCANNILMTVLTSGFGGMTLLPTLLLDFILCIPNYVTKVYKSYKIEEFYGRLANIGYIKVSKDNKKLSKPTKKIFTNYIELNKLTSLLPAGVFVTMADAFLILEKELFYYKRLEDGDIVLSDKTLTSLKNVEGTYLQTDNKDRKITDKIVKTVTYSDLNQYLLCKKESNTYGIEFHRIQINDYYSLKDVYNVKMPNNNDVKISFELMEFQNPMYKMVEYLRIMYKLQSNIEKTQKLYFPFADSIDGSYDNPIKNLENVPIKKTNEYDNSLIIFNNSYGYWPFIDQTNNFSSEINKQYISATIHSMLQLLFSTNKSLDNMNRLRRKKKYSIDYTPINVEAQKDYNAKYKTIYKKDEVKKFIHELDIGIHFILNKVDYMHKNSIRFNPIIIEIIKFLAGEKLGSYGIKKDSNFKDGKQYKLSTTGEELDIDYIKNVVLRFGQKMDNELEYKYNPNDFMVPGFTELTDAEVEVLEESEEDEDRIEVAILIGGNVNSIA